MLKESDEKGSVFDRVSAYVISWKDVAQSWTDFSFQENLRDRASGVVEAFTLENIRSQLSFLNLFGSSKGRAKSKRKSVSDVYPKKGEEEEFEMSMSGKLHRFQSNSSFVRDKPTLVTDEEGIQTAEAEEKMAGDVTNDVVELSEKMEDAGFDIQAISPPVNGNVKHVSCLFQYRIS